MPPEVRQRRQDLPPTLKGTRLLHLGVPPMQKEAEQRRLHNIHTLKVLNLSHPVKWRMLKATERLPVEVFLMRKVP